MSYLFLVFAIPPVSAFGDLQGISRHVFDCRAVTCGFTWGRQSMCGAFTWRFTCDCWVFTCECQGWLEDLLVSVRHLLEDLLVGVGHLRIYLWVGCVCLRVYLSVDNLLEDFLGCASSVFCLSKVSCSRNFWLEEPEIFCFCLWDGCFASIARW